MKTYNEFISIIEKEEDPNYDIGRFVRLIDQTEDCTIDEVDISYSKVSSIRRFYEDTNHYNRVKIVDLINTNIRNINKVHKIVIDYEKNKNQREV